MPVCGLRGRCCVRRCGRCAVSTPALRTLLLVRLCASHVRVLLSCAARGGLVQVDTVLVAYGPAGVLAFNDDCQANVRFSCLSLTVAAKQSVTILVAGRNGAVGTLRLVFTMV